MDSEKDLKSLLIKHQRRLQKLKETRALSGLSVDPSILIQIEDVEAEIEKLKTALNSSTAKFSPSSPYDVTNRYESYFVNDFTGLLNYYKSPDPVFNRVQVTNFVGREWLTHKLDAFLNNPTYESGAFVLVGEAGVGKTAYLAHLVMERHYLHLFGEQFRGDVYLEGAVQSLGAQLIARYGLKDVAHPDIMPKAPYLYETFLERLLRLAAARLGEGEKIIIVCDGLDEAGAVPGGNVFALPSVLPPSVYLILSRRPPEIAFKPRFFIQNAPLKADGFDNLQDVRNYLLDIANHPDIAKKLQQGGYKTADFVRIMSHKSGGVWMYVDYVIQEIKQNRRGPLDLAKLPPGLAGYYAEYWGDWRKGRNHRGQGQEQWNKLYAPLLATLAAAQEPIAPERLASWANVSAHPQEIKYLLREEWSAFLTERKDLGPGPSYQLYHRSLREFLTGDVPLEQLMPESRYLIEDLVGHVREAHQRIVEDYRQQCNKGWPKLVEHDYPRRFLTYHLAGSGNFEELINLVIESDDWAKARYQYENSYSGYFVDLDVIWDHVKSIEGWNIGYQLRCALIESSIRSLAENILPKLVFQLVESKLWSVDRALVHISQLHNVWWQAQNLRTIAPLIPEALKSEALLLAQEIQAKWAQAHALTALIPYLPAELKDIASREALVNAREMVGYVNKEEQDHIFMRGHSADDERAEILANLVPLLANDLRIEALQLAREIANPFTRVKALSGLVNHLPDELKLEVVEEALAAVEAMNEDWQRGWSLKQMAGHLPAGLKAEALQKAKGMVDAASRARGMTGLVGDLPEALKYEAVEAALSAIQEIKADDWDRKYILEDLAGHLPDDLKVKALQWADELDDEKERAEVLQILAKHLPDALIPKALEIAQGISLKAARAEALSSFVDRLPGASKIEAINDILAMIPEVENDYVRGSVLSQVVNQLPDELIPRALQVAEENLDKYHRVSVLAALAKRCINPLKDEIVMKALEFGKEIDDWGWVEAFNDLLGQLSDEMKLEALVAIQQITDVKRCVIGLSNAADHLKGDLKIKTLYQALAAAQRIDDAGTQAKTLVDLSTHLPPTLQSNVLSETLPSTWQTANHWERSQALQNVAGKLPGPLKAEALISALEIGNESARAQALLKLVDHFPDDLKVKAVAEALAATREIGDEERRSGNLYQLAGYLSGELRREVLAEAVVAARKITNIYSKPKRLCQLANYFPDHEKQELLSEVLIYAQSNTSEFALKVLTYILNELPQDLRDTVVDQVLRIFSIIVKDGSFNHNSEWGTMIEYLPAALTNQALQTARGISKLSSRAEALADLVERLPGQLKTDIVHEILVLGSGMDNDWQTARLLTQLANSIPDGLKQKALEIARGLSDHAAKVEALIAVGSHLTRNLKGEVLGEALTTAWGIQDEAYCAAALVALAPHLSGEVKAKVLQEAFRAARVDGWPFAEIASLWGEIEFVGLKDNPSLWVEVLRACAYNRRRDLLRNLSGLGPMIAHLGGPEAIKYSCYTIIDLSTWWS